MMNCKCQKFPSSHSPFQSIPRDVLRALHLAIPGKILLPVYIILRVTMQLSAKQTILEPLSVGDVFLDGGGKLLLLFIM